MKNKHTGVFPRRLRALTWINIGVQACFPLTVAFTPAVLAASSHSQSATRSTTQTQLYTLKVGETPASVARAFGLSLGELRTLNRFRTFARGFDHLQPGDELEVPLTSGASTAPGDLKGGATGDASPHDDAQALQVAGAASQAGTFLANNPNGDAAASLARGMAAGEATREVQDWMNRFGTARVQLGVDKDFSLKNSQLDLLVPLYEQQDLLTFTQGSLHRTDDRTQANLGVGVRWFSADWMLGGNTFLDHDLSRDHSRLGVGVEYWRDFLKLGANSYLRLSNWKDSPDLDDYQERPANGWDIRAQGWLPALPQLGAKLTYEQYYGDEVGLFGKDHRQRDPHAITAGIDYTPVPLLTLSAEQRQGKGGENDTRFGVDFRYQLGASWQQQTDPTGVQVMRSLAGSRHDLVERNNNIVLEYRQKETIRLRTAPLVTGYAGERKSLGVTVSSNNGVDRIDWSAPALLAAGGQIVEDGPQAYSVVMPSYQFSQGVNNYTVTGVAVDKKGGRSNSSETQVSVRAPTINESSSTFTPSNSALLANGTDTQVLTLTIRDGQDNPVDVPADAVTINAGTLKSATVSAVTRTATGVYAVTVTAGTDEETLTLTPVVEGVSLSAAHVVISSTAPSPTNSTVSTDKESITADGQDSMTITFVAKDASNNPIPGIAGDITFKVVDSQGNPAPAGAVTVSPATEISPPGTYTATLTGDKADSYTVIPQYNGNPVGDLEVPVELKAGDTPDGTQSTFATPSPQSIIANGTDTSTLTFTAKDAKGNVINDLTDVTFAVTAADVTPQLAGKAASPVTVSAVTNAGNGTYTAQLSGTLAGTYTVTPQNGGSPVGSLSDTVTLTADTNPSPTNSTVSTDKESITADGQDSMTITFVAKDANNNPIPGIAGDITFKVVDSQGNPAPAGAVTVSPATEISPPGTYTATLTGDKADSYTVIPQYNGNPVGDLEVPVELKADTTPDAGPGNSTFTPPSPQSITANGTDTSTLSFTAKDAKGNLISGLTGVTFAVTDGNGNPVTSGVTVSSTTNAGNGTYTAQLSGTLAGTYTVTPQNGGSPVGSLSDTVTLTADTNPSPTNSTVSTDKESITADGQDSMTITFVAKDANNNPIPGIAGDITFKVVDSQGNPAPAGAVTVSPATEISPPGTYTATLTGDKADSYTVIPQYNGNPVGDLEVPVELKADTTPDAGPGNSTFTPPSPQSITANGTDTSTLSFTAKDAKGNLISGLTGVTFAVTDGNGNPVTSGVTVSSTTNAGNGTYTAQLSGTLAGTYTVTPQNGGSPVGGLSDTVTLTAGTTPDAGPGNSTFTPPSPQSITADGIATSTLSFTAKDANGNLITDLTAVTFAVTDGNGNPVTSGISVSGTTNAGNGTYTAQLSGTLAGTYTVTPQNGGSPVGNLSDTVTLTAGTTPDTGAGNSTLTVSPPSITAGNTETSTLTFTAKDAHGNLIAGLTSLVVTVTGSDGNPVEGEAVTVSDVTETGSPGVYTATLGGTLADTYTAALTLNGAPLSGLSATVAVTAGTTPDDGQTLFYADVGAIIPDGDDTATLTLEAKDVFGNAITGLAAQGLTFELSPTSASMTLSAVTDAGNGKYTATLKGTQAGDYTVTPKINGTQVGTKSELIHVAAVATDVQDILVNGYTFAKDAGFPKTGFIGAKFTVQLNGGEPTDVIWSSSSNWAHVDDSGNVSFNAIGDSSMVTITATSKADTSRAFTYQFTVENWFKSAGSFASGTAAEAGCAEIGGRLPTSLEQSGLEYTQNNSVQVDRGVGNLYGEWGPELPGSGLTKGIAAQGPSYVKTDPQPQQVCGRKYTRTPGMSLTGSAGYVQISNVGYDNGSGRFSSCQPNRYYQVEAFCRVSGN